MSDDNELVIVFSGDLINAGLLKGLLDDRRITAFLRDEIMGHYVEPAGAGAVKVAVPRSELEKAKPIVQRFLVKKDSIRKQR